MEEKRLIGAAEVSELLGVSIPYAYKIMRDLNEELRKNNYLTIHGKVDLEYLKDRYFTHNRKEA